MKSPIRTLVHWSVVGAVVGVFGACGGDDGGGVAGNQFGGSGGKLDGGPDGSGANGGTAGTAPIECAYGDTKCEGNTLKACSLDGTWIDSQNCPFVCSNGACGGTCAPGTTKCKLGGEQTCDATGEWQKVSPCEFGCDSATGACRTGCNAGDFHCNGNEVQQCDAGPPSKWVPVSPAVTCNASAGQKCDEQTGTCKSLTPIGTDTPTGNYYQYAVFEKDQTPFLGGYDVDSIGDMIYVNRGGTYLDVYKVTLLDSDNDGKLEPDQHPDNPNATGPIEERKLEFIKTLTKASDNVPLGSASHAEIFAASEDKLYMLGPSHDGVISEYLMGPATSSVMVQPSSAITLSVMGFGDANGVWYGGGESARRVYSYHEPTKSWVAEFDYPNLAGSHMDGMEVVVAPKTGEQYVYVSDMTSDFIAQYHQEETGWVQANLYQYNDGTGSPVEGFGFGALNHFWATSGSYLYEVGGGEIQEFLEPCPAGKQVCGEAGQTCPSGQVCLNGCCEGIR
ncbi:MAG: hypothetical protein KC776_41510 [Myxococcales bacterium]|nr:hypothetical protein [Myxococcales bacterium]MCB9578751.1 hypothetical protein [Polyangiaceae bacterium]